MRCSYQIDNYFQEYRYNQIKCVFLQIQNRNKFHRKIILAPIFLMNDHRQQNISSYQNKNSEKNTNGSRNILQSSGSSFKSSGSFQSKDSSNSAYFGNKGYPHTEILQAFLQILQKGNLQIIANLQFQSQRANDQNNIGNRELYTMIKCLFRDIEIALSEENIDVQVFGLMDAIASLINQILDQLQHSNNKLIFKSNQSQQNFQHVEQIQNANNFQNQNSLKQANKEDQIEDIIMKQIFQFIYKLFTGSQNQKFKQIYTNIVLNLDEGYQRIFMYIISTQMAKENKMKDVKNKKVRDLNITKGVSLKDKNSSGIDSVNQEYIIPKKDKNTYFELGLSELSKNSSGIQKQQQSTLEMSNQQNLSSNGSANLQCKNCNSPHYTLTQLITRILQTEEQCQILLKELENSDNVISCLKRQNQQLKLINHKLQIQNKKFQKKMIGYVQKIQKMESDYSKQKAKIQEKWQNIVKVLQKNKQKQIQQLKKLYEISNSSHEQKISEYQSRLSTKRSKIAQFQKQIEELNDQLNQLTDKNKKYEKQVVKLCQQLQANRKQKNQLQITKDLLTMEIQARDNRIQDMRIILMGTKNKRKSTGFQKEKENDHEFQIIDDFIRQLSVEEENSQINGDLSWAKSTNQWKNSSHASQFQKLNLKANHNGYTGTGHSWFRHSFKNTITNPHANYPYLAVSSLSPSYHSHNNYLSQKLHYLENEYHKRANKEVEKKLRDLQSENNNLMRIIREYECYRGEQNQIMLGVMYQIRKKAQNLIKQRSNPKKVMKTAEDQCSADEQQLNQEHQHKKINYSINEKPQCETILDQLKQLQTSFDENNQTEQNKITHRQKAKDQKKQSEIQICQYSYTEY